MPTTKRRINITLDPDTERGVNLLAKHKKQSKSSIIVLLTREALELQEDIALAKIAERREAMGLKYIPDSDDIWK